MDLIDREELLKRFELTSQANGNAIRYEIKCAPTVDAEPVRRGKWLMESDGGTRCSACKGKVHDVTDGSYAPVDLSELPYCPKCGSFNGGSNETLHS